MIELKQVSKLFNTGKPNQVIAINELDLNIQAGEYLVIVGSNGSGKSTLLNLIAGSTFATTGSLYVDSTNVTRLPDYQRSRWIARVFQNPLSGTAPDLSVLDNFRLAALRTQPKGLRLGINQQFKQLVKEKIALLNMGLEGKTDQLMGSLSGGQRQALTLLMSIMADCKIILLDEPSAALDPRSANMVMETADKLIKDYKLTAILITHNLKEAFTYGNRLIHMQDGQIIKDLLLIDKVSLKQNDLFSWFG